MKLQRDSDANHNSGDRVGEVMRATRRREGLGIILTVIVVSCLLIVGLSYVMDPPPATGVDPETTPPATYRAQ